MLNASFTGGGEKFKYYALLDLQYDNGFVKNPDTPVSYTHLHLLVLLLPEPFSLFIGKITQKNPLYLIIYAKKYVLCAEMYQKV